MSLPTASGLGRAIACPASTVLPQTKREAGSFVQQRVAFHAFVDAANKRGRDQALAECPEEWRSVFAQIDLSQLPADPAAYATEVALAWDPTTDKARELNRAGIRDYSQALPSEFVGTADALALYGDDAVLVEDLKPRYNSTTPPARENWQLKFLALAAARLHGRTRAVVELVHADEYGSWRDRAEFDALDLDMIAGELALLRTRIERERSGAAPAESAEGAHCRYCDSFAYCPAKKSLAMSLATGAIGIPVEGELVLSAENAGIAWQRVKLARQVLDRIEESLEQFAREAPFSTPDGLVVSAGERRTETIDGSVAAAVLGRLGLGDAVEAKVTKSAITKLAGKARAPEVLEALRAAGALKVTITNPVQERRS